MTAELQTAVKLELPSQELQRVALADEPLLLPYQSKPDHLLETTALLAIDKSRRIGFTWGLGSVAVLRAASAKSARGSNVFYISYDKEMTREFIEVCADWATLLGSAAEEIGAFLFEDQYRTATGELVTKQIQAFRIRFASGHSIVALSSAPRALRGRQGLVIIDEAAFHEELAELLKSALALTIWGDQVIVVSSHNGQANPFNKLIQDIRSGAQVGKVLTVTFKDAIDQGLYRRICLVKGLVWSQEAQDEWEAGVRKLYGEAGLEELDCIPSQGGESWLKFPLILQAEDDRAGFPEAYRGGHCFVGVDIGRRRDLWVAWVWERVGDVLWTREIIELENKTFAEHDAKIAYIFRRYRVLRLRADQTGMGEKPVEDWRVRHGSRVEGVLMTSDNRLLVATHGREGFENHKVRIPAGVPELRDDLSKVKRVSGPTGAPRLVAGRDANGHADRSWAAWLGISAAAEDTGPFEFMTSGDGRASLGAFAGAQDPLQRFGGDRAGADQPAFNRVNLTGY
jgi:phage FluMu gp28-like protein